MNWTIIHLAVFSVMLFTMILVLMGSFASTKASEDKEYLFKGMICSNIIELTTALGYFILVLNGNRSHTSQIFKSLFLGTSFVSYYSLTSLFTFYVTNLIRKKKRISYLWANLTIPVCSVFAILWFTSCFNGFIYNIETETTVRGISYLISQLGGCFVLADDILLITVHRKTLGSHDTLILLTFLLFPILAVIVHSFFPMFSFMPIALSFSIMFNYIFLLLNQARRIQEQEIQLSKNKIAIMTSQIQPHFVFNALNTIYILCGRDTETAKKAISDFSSYLRANIESLQDDTLIPVTKDIEHLEHYLNLEKLRFREELNIVYRIEDTDFNVPPLTIQPIVENAVKHGILKKKGGGTVTVSTKESESSHRIIIRDDGVGFDAAERLSAKDLHVGMKNVRERLCIMCGGTLTVQSEIGKGTSVTMEIPKDFPRSRRQHEHTGDR